MQKENILLRSISSDVKTLSLVQTHFMKVRLSRMVVTIFSIVNAIQNPGTFYTDGNKWDTEYRYFNLWSMQTTSQTDVSKTLIKTIYDPCPVGFSMPPLKTFSGVTITGKTNTNNKDINALGDWDQGWHFYAKDSSSPSTVYYPAIGSRTAKEGKLYGVKDRGYYWLEYHLLPAQVIT